MKECTRKTDGVKFAVKCINKHALNPKDRSNLAQEISILKEVSGRPSANNWLVQLPGPQGWRVPTCCSPIATSTTC